jgi:metal-responsive CopG/Arc/MetJ family transcriptional regulator
MSQEKINDLSTKELKKLLDKRLQEEREQSRMAREAYETSRDVLVVDMIVKANKLHQEMVAFKNEAISKLEEFRKAAQEYGEIRSNSKGGFSLRSSDQQLMISYDRNTKSEYDERADLAEQLLREFLEDKVKKRDKKAYRTIMALITRNSKTGQFNPVSINSLLSVEDNYDDERWVKAMKLFKESYNNIFISMSVSFYKKDSQDKDQLIPLTFASL